MHQKGSIVPALVGIAFIVIIVGAIIYLVVSNIAGREPDEELLPETSPVTALGPQRSVRMNVRGAIIAREDHNEYSITVSPDSREISVYQGYTFDQIVGDSYGNSAQAYEAFVYALEREGLGEEREVSDDEADPRGACPTGKVYTFTVLNGGSEVESWWRGSCSKEGTLDNRANPYVNLFHKQIPNFKDFMRDLDIRV